MISCCDKKRFPMVRLAGLEDENADLLLFSCTGILPNIKPLDFGVSSKGELRTTAKAQYDERNKRNMSRLSGLSEELDNIPMTAIRLGFPYDLLSPRYQSMLQLIRNNVHPGQAQDMPPASFQPPSQSSGALSLADGSVSEAAPAAQLGGQGVAAIVAQGGHGVMPAAPQQEQADAHMVHNAAHVASFSLPKMRFWPHPTTGNGSEGSGEEDQRPGKEC